APVLPLLRKRERALGHDDVSDVRCDSIGESPGARIRSRSRDCGPRNGRTIGKIAHVPPARRPGSNGRRARCDREHVMGDRAMPATSSKSSTKQPKDAANKAAAEPAAKPAAKLA